MNGDDFAKQLRESERAALRMILKADKAERFWRIGAMIFYVVLAGVLAWAQGWWALLTLASLTFLVFVMIPRSNATAEQGGWSQAWTEAIRLADRVEMPSDVIVEMILMCRMGPPSEKARMDRWRMRLAELDKELGE